MISFFTLLTISVILVCVRDTVTRSKLHYKSKSSIGKFYLVKHFNNLIFLIRYIFYYIIEIPYSNNYYNNRLT